MMKSVTSQKVTSEKVASQYEASVLKNYGPAPFAIVRGKGSQVWDAENRRYLDFCTGIAVNSVGHSHPVWVERIREQAGQLVHVSNLFHSPLQAELAGRLCALAGPGKVFFCNSGTEANEFLVKLSRLWGKQKSKGEEGKCYKVITATNSFHGRTYAGMSATPQAKIQNGFSPLLPGFLHAPFNDLQAFRDLVDDSVSAILLESIQGEGGIHPATVEFLQGIRSLCDEKGILMLIDEVQCGIGRTGKFFAYEHAGIVPDAIALAKGLGGGFPIGAGWIKDPVAELFQPGSHGSTFGGNPLACAAALAVLDIIESEGLLEQVETQSRSWHQALTELVAKHPDHLTGMRGLGYHTALITRGDPLPWVGRLRENGLLTVRGGTDAIRLMPPLNVSIQDLDTSVEILDLTFGTHVMS